MSGLFSRLFGQEVPGESVARDTLVDWFTRDHQGCDDLWASVEAAGDDLATVRQAFLTFDGRLRAHLALEEDLLFPEFDEKSGMNGMGPTAVMRMEHAQMRALLDQMSRASAAQEIRNLGDTLLMLIQQHNAKEEGMLYPMAERVVDWAALRPKLPTP